jgi:NAD(P)-dependent dehydrogenase (short-subunit alcohol dehydrogenase family)
MNRLLGKTAFLAGATSGIGRAAAELFAAEGARVVVAGRRVAEGEAVVNGIRELGGEAIFIRTDVTEEASVASAIDQSVRHYGSLNVIFSNAGGSSNKDGSVVDAALDEFWRVMKLDVYGTFLCNRFAIPHLIAAGGGAIINMASHAGVVGSPGRDAYSSAKGAVVTLTRTLAKEYAAKKIRVNAIAPAGVATSRIKKMMEDPKIRAMVESTQVLGLISPEEIAATAVFLASEEARCMTGQILSVHAGAF